MGGQVRRVGQQELGVTGQQGGEGVRHRQVLHGARLQHLGEKKKKKDTKFNNKHV